MCRLASFFHNPINGDIVVHDINSHSETQKALNLNEKLWREGHYFPDGTIECRVTNSDHISQDECNERLRNRFPNFIDFFNWSMDEICKDGAFSGSLDLRSLTSAAGLKLPTEIGGSLYLSSLTSAAGLKLPTKCGSLYLRSLTSAAGLKLPTKCGYLDLRSEVKQQYQDAINKMEQKTKNRKAKKQKDSL